MALHCKLAKNHINNNNAKTFPAFLLPNSFFVVVQQINQQTQRQCMSQASKTIHIIYQRRDLWYLLWDIYKCFSFLLLKPKFKECFTFKINGIIYHSRQTHLAACATVFIYFESILNSFLCIAGEVTAVPLIYGTWELLLPPAPNKKNWCELTECWEHMLGNLELFFSSRLGSLYLQCVLMPSALKGIVHSKLKRAV